MLKRKLVITLPEPPPEPKPFLCSLCGEMRLHWQRYIEGKRRNVCVECANFYTPPHAHLGWRHYEVFAHRDASVVGGILHLIVMLRART
jgi:hypothetical protein